MNKEEQERKEWQNTRKNMIDKNFVHSGYIVYVYREEDIKLTGDLIKPDWEEAYYDDQGLQSGEFDGEKIIVEYFGIATIVWGTESTIMKLLNKEIEYYNTTKEEAEAWLKEYRNCAHVECYQLIAGETPILGKFKER